MLMMCWVTEPSHRKALLLSALRASMKFMCWSLTRSAYKWRHLPFRLSSQLMQVSKLTATSNDVAETKLVTTEVGIQHENLLAMLVSIAVQTQTLPHPILVHVSVSMALEPYHTSLGVSTDIQPTSDSLVQTVFP